MPSGVMWYRFLALHLLCIFSSYVDSLDYITYKYTARNCISAFQEMPYKFKKTERKLQFHGGYYLFVETWFC